MKRSYRSPDSREWCWWISVFTEIQVSNDTLNNFFKQQITARLIGTNWQDFCKKRLLHFCSKRWPSCILLPTVLFFFLRFLRDHDAEFLLGLIRSFSARPSCGRFLILFYAKIHGEIFMLYRKELNSLQASHVFSLKNIQKNLSCVFCFLSVLELSINWRKLPSSSLILCAFRLISRCSETMVKENFFGRFLRRRQQTNFCLISAKRKKSSDHRETARWRTTLYRFTDCAKKLQKPGFKWMMLMYIDCYRVSYYKWQFRQCFFKQQITARLIGPNWRDFRKSCCTFVQ